MTLPPTQRTAIIDLGSNSARVIVLNFRAGYTYHLEDEIREIVRLREGMSERGLSEAAMERAFSTLRLFKRFCESVGADTIIPTATSAVREASNGPAFVARVAEEIGLALQVLDGDREAFYGALGALNAVPLQEGVVLDIGGGSAQLSLVREGRFVEGQALTLGALALTERFVRSDPIRGREFKAIKQEIERQLDTVGWLEEAPAALVGLGGTIRNLAKVEAARQGFPLESIGGFRLTRQSLSQTIRLLRELPLAERQGISGLKSDRADIILPGALVLRAVMKRLGVEELLISEHGLREGLFFEQFWSHLPYPVHPDLRDFNVLNMARFYGFKERHAYHVRHLSTRLFDQLAPLHGFGPHERELLAAAALLHDLGTVISYNDHHKHSETLIASNGLSSFTSRETALVALLARYHRKGTPTPGPYEPLFIEGDEGRLLCLSAMLRTAEYLERGRNGIVRDVEVDLGEDVVLSLVAEEFPAVELWETERNALELLSRALGRPVTLQSEVAPATA